MLFRRNGFFFLFILLKAASSKLTISFAVTMLSCARQVPPTSLQCTHNPCQQSFTWLLITSRFCDLQSLKHPFSVCKETHT